MTTIKDLLLELRAIRIGIQLLLRAYGGTEPDLLQRAKDNLANEQAGAYKRQKPRDHKSIIHSDPEVSRAREMLEEMGDDTLAVIEYARQQFGDEAAEGMRQFYEREIVGKR